MFDAIQSAELGDDVFGEDPTVNRLEKLAAEKMGKEDALLVASGTQANLISLMSNTKRGELVILEAESHIYWYEVGGISTIAGLLPWPIKSHLGTPTPEDVENAIRPQNIHFPKPTLICLENTHNRYGGTILKPDEIKAINEVARKHDLRLYLDGARIFNASVALGIDVKEIACQVDNLMFCLSKGLCCPVGSLVVGNHEFIERARKIRKVLGIVALETMIERLAEDHRNARLLAERIAKIKGIQIDLASVQTNIVCFDISGFGLSDDVFLQNLKKKGIFALTIGKNKIRMVTHNGIEDNQIEETVTVIENMKKDAISI
jgi:threonine aldolase